MCSLAPPALPIPGLQLAKRSPTLANKSHTPSANTQPPFAMSSKSLPATPASTPQVEQLPTAGFMSRLFGSNKQNKPVSSEQLSGLSSSLLFFLGKRLKVKTTNIFVFSLAIHLFKRQLVPNSYIFLFISSAQFLFILV
jgi:hypothetical protein